MVLLLWSGSALFEQSKRKNSITEPIRIGAVLSLTGPAASYGESAKQGIDLAVEEINARGGMNGRLIEVMYEDDLTSTKDTVSAYRKLVDIDDVDAVIGSVWDFTTQAILPLAEEDQITLISPTNFRLEDSFELGEHSFVPFPSFERVVRVLERYLIEQNVQKVAIVRFTSSFAEVIRDTLGDTMQARNGSSVIDETYAAIGGNDFRTTIAKLQEEEVDFVFVDAVDSDILNFVQRANELGYTGIIASHVLALDLIDNPNVSDELLEGLVILNWQVAPKEFAQRFKSKYGFPPQDSADSSYNVLYILAEAVANTNSRAEVSDYIENYTFTTINGDFTFSKNHTVENLPVNIEIVRNGKTETLYSSN